MVDIILADYVAENIGANLGWTNSANILSIMEF